MYDLLFPVLTKRIFCSINLMSVYISAKFQPCCAIIAKSAVQYIRNQLIFLLPRAFLWTL
jgi:hypothetical protein